MCVAVGENVATALADVAKMRCLNSFRCSESQSIMRKYVAITSPIQLAFFEPGLCVAVISNLNDFSRPLKLPIMTPRSLGHEAKQLSCNKIFKCSIL